MTYLFLGKMLFTVIVLFLFTWGLIALGLLAGEIERRK